MNIALDGNEANVKERVGTGQYTYNILKIWHDNKSHDFHIYLRNAPLEDMPNENSNWHYHVVGPNRAWTRFALPFALMLSRKHNVFWNPAHYLPPATFSKSVVTIHDLAYEYYPELFLPSDLYKLKNWTLSSVKKADQIIAVSEATKKDLVKLYGVKESKITVIYNGYDHELFNTDDKLSTKRLTEYKLLPHKYILFVGTIQPRKNVGNLVHAFSILKDKGYTGKLVLAGRIGWLADSTLQVVERSKYKSDIVLTGYISELDRKILNRFAEIEVLPSLYEGFGVPLIEAMASGTPVAGSNNSSLPEVIGKGGELFDPTSPEDIAKKVLMVQENREKYAKLGLVHASKFSWEKCAKETLNLITH